MGTWGTGIFADDLAADVRGDWRDALLGGLSPEVATTMLIERFADAAADVDESPRFWMALAAAQSETGRLQPLVRDRALEVIEAGADIAQFEPSDQGRRRHAIARLAEKLRGPQRAPVTLARPKPQASPVVVGDVVRIRGERESALFLVVDLAKGWPPGSQLPVLAGLQLSADDLNSQDVFHTAPLIRDRSPSTLFPDPVVAYYAVSGPSRGPRSFSNFGETVAHGVVRNDVPPVPKSATKHAQLGYSSWQALSRMIDEGWYSQMASITDAFEARRAGRWKSLSHRLRGD